MSDFKTPNDFRKGSYKKYPYQDPTYLSFALLFDWSSIETSPLLSGAAEAFLEGLANSKIKQSTGTSDVTSQYYADRLADLRSFKHALREINTNMPWYWQSLKGLARLQQYDPLAPYYGGDDAKLEIETLESLNLPIAGLMHLYRSAIFDERKWAYIIPQNLRKFKMMIYVTDVRTQTVAEIAGESNRPYFMMGLGYCEFDMNSGTSIFEDLSKNPEGEASGSISISYETLEKIEARALNGIIEEPEYANNNMSPAPSSENDLEPTPSNALSANAEKTSTVKSKMQEKINAAKSKATDAAKAFAADKKSELVQEVRNQTVNRVQTPENVFDNYIRKLDEATDINRAVQNLGNTTSENMPGNVYGMSIKDALNKAAVNNLGNIYE